MIFQAFCDLNFVSSQPQLLLLHMNPFLDFYNNPQNNRTTENLINIFQCEIRAAQLKQVEAHLISTSTAPVKEANKNPRTKPESEKRKG